MHVATTVDGRILCALSTLVLCMACDRGPSSASAQDEVEEAVITDLAGVPPGADAFDEALGEQLGGLVQTRYVDGDEVPRTVHRHPDGRPLFTNRLALESSPYLRQHAHNPVDWYPWGDEAFDTALRLDRPVFLSVGYSTCHWCHVMEEESFEDLEIAEYINTHYIAVKVDREQRPDVDSIYMTAVYHFNGRGGWPMTVVLTPDRVPFFAATYIPARDGDRGSRTGLLTILGQLSDMYRTQSDVVMDRTLEVAQRIAASAQPARPGAVPDHRVIEAAVEGLRSRFDRRWGGFGNAPKFPRPCTYSLLLRYYRRTGAQWALDMVTTSLDHMADGGMYDQIGGGFHRYSTDQRWLVPHFEKMLYDNAQLAVLYLEAYQITDNAHYARIVTEILDYVAREMTSPEGAFYSATDADSEGEEGTFFLWDESHIRSLLPAESAEMLIDHYGVTERGNFEHRNILSVMMSLDEAARRAGVPADEAAERFVEARQVLYDARLERIAPGLDDKVLAAWNGLMIGAFARAGQILERPDYIERAQQAAAAIERHMWIDGRLRRSYRQGEVVALGFLDDYAFLESGLLDLFEATNEPRWLEWAVVLQAVVDRHFSDSAAGGYFFTSNEHETLLAREKPDYDGAEPSSNSLAAENLLRLAEFTTNHAYRERVEALFSAFASSIRRSPMSVPRLLAALDFYLDEPWELVFVNPPTGADLEPFEAILRHTFLPNRVRVAVTEGAEARETIEATVPLVRLKPAMGGQSTAYVCQAGVCQQPTTDPAEFARQIAPVTPYGPEPVE